MKKGYKQYIEKHYPVIGSDEENIVIEEVSSVEPLLVNFSDKITCFRYFEAKPCKTDDGVVLKDRSNYSKMYYFGNRVSTDDEMGIYVSRDIMINYLKSNGYDNAIFCRNGKIVCNVSDDTLTMDEAKEIERRRIADTYVFNEEDFFTGLAMCLGYVGRDVSLMIHDSYWYLSDEIDLGEEEEMVPVRTYQVFEQTYPLVSKSSIIPGDTIGDTRIGTSINLNQIMDVVEPLYLEHPYLNGIMNKVKLDVFAGNSSSIKDLMFDAAIDRLDNREAYERAIVYEKTRNDN